MAYFFRERQWSHRVFSGGGLSQRGLYLLFFAVLVFSALVRLPGCFSELWLDEIWTLFGTNTLNSPIEIFTRVRHDNNHHLNTLFLYLLGDRQSWAIYRIHSLLSGVGAVVLSWFIGLYRGKAEAVIAAVLTGGSYLMIHFSSEARGYSLAVFFAFALFFAIQRFADNKRWFWAVAIWICVCLGFLSHLTYLHVFVASIIWLSFRLFKKCKSKLDAVINCIKCLGVPLLFLGCFYIFIARGIIIGLGPKYKLVDVLIETFSYMGGGPAAGMFAVGVSLITAGLFLLSIIWLLRKGHSEWMFFLIVIFLSPGITVLVKRPPMLFVRYFLINIVFGFILTSYILADLCRRGRLIGLGVVVVILLFLIGNGLNVARLFKYGRGGYLEAVHYMADNTDSDVIKITSDHDFRNSLLLKYYKRYLPQGKRIEYIDKAKFGEQGAMWLILHYIGSADEVFPVVDYCGHIYDLIKIFPSSDLSGFYWFIYRRQEGSGSIDDVSGIMLKSAA